mgnify:CR=1 FL=1
MNTLNQLDLTVGSSTGSASSNTPNLPTVVRGSHLGPRLSKLQPPSLPNHRCRLTVGLPPSSLASVALTKHQVDDAENSDLLVENMLRALIHMDTTPRSDVSSPLSPAVLAFDLSAGRAASFSKHASPAHCPWERANEWSSDGTQVLGSQDSPTTLVRRRLAAIRCTSASPKKRPSPYLRQQQSTATSPARANDHRHWMQPLRFSPLRPRSPNGPATPTAEPAAARTRPGWAHGGAQDLVLRQGRVMAL